MGQTHSQESESPSPPKSEPEDQDFDISQIPDDRDQDSRPNSDAEPDRNPAPAPDESTSMAERSARKRSAQTLAVRQGVDKPWRESKKRSRRRRRSQINASDDAAHEISKRASPPVRHPRDKSPNDRPLQDTEPETYHIYAVSDTSDADNARSSERPLANNTFTAVNGASQKDAASVSYPRLDNLASKQAETIHTGSAPAVALVEGTQATNGEVWAPPATEEPQPKMNSKGRFLCPLAKVHNCNLTFGSKKTATRHANIHATSQCVVCGKQMSRNDALATHMKLHSAMDIATAEAHSIPNEDPEAEIPDQPQSAQPNVSNDAHTPVGDGEPPEEDSIGFTTPHEQPEPRDYDHNIEVELQPDGQEGLEIEMSEATPAVNIAKDVSDNQSTSPSSVFDETEDMIVKETPMPKGDLKRKRSSGGPPQRPSPESARKRRKGSPNSPPTSVPPNEPSKPDSLKKPGATELLQSRQITDKIVPRLQKRQRSMDGWAQKYTPGSNLRHPTLNPKSPPPRAAKLALEVVIPRTSQAGSSRMKSKKKDRRLADGATSVDHERSGESVSEGLGRKEGRKAPYATAKGKKRAEPDVDYSTPTRDSTGVEVHISESNSDSEPADIATSVAKRSFPAPRTREQDQEEDDDSYLAADQSDGTDSDVDEGESAKKAHRATKAPKPRRSDHGDSAECPRCHRKYAGQAQLNRHLKKPSAHVGLLRCQDCSEEFWAPSALVEHEKDTGHGKVTSTQGCTGAFTQAEVSKLNKWRDRFCAYHDISRIQFNDMMTDTMARGEGTSWNWPFITRAEFLKEYVDVLPARNKRSMLRYRQRNFQNVEGSRNWTAEDDNDLIRLHKELGPKWAEIARRLARTVDAVSQRWQHRLRYGEVDTGEWSKAEDDRLSKILDELRRGLDGQKLQDYRIPWNKVGERMGTRSAQQCSNHYRARHSRKERGRWVRVDASEKGSRSSRMSTPSKMELRLGVKMPRTRTSRKGLSEEYIVDDDEDGDDGAEEGQGDGEASEDDKSGEDSSNEDTSSEHESHSEAAVEDEEEVPSSAEDGHSAREIPRAGIPLITKTPGKTLGSSQLFEQTQANTSALKPSQTSSRKARLQDSQERPSPNIPIQRRRLGSRSPLKEIPVQENGDLALDEEEDEEKGSESRTSDGEESDDLGAVQQTDEEQDSSPEGSADQDDDVLAEQDVDAEAAETEDDDDDDNDDDDTTHTGEDTDEDDGGDDGDSVDEDSSREDEEDEEDGDSGTSVENESSFMDSINESAKRSRVRSSQTSIGRPVPGKGSRDRRRLHQSDQEDSDEE